MLQSGEVLRRSIAFVLRKSIVGIEPVAFKHQAVAGDLGDHAGGRDAVAESVPAHERGLRDRKRMNRQAIDEHMLRHDAEGGRGTPHRLMRRAEDVDSVHFRRFQDRHSPRDVLPSHELLEDCLPLPFRQLLRVIQSRETNLFRKNHGSSDHRTGKRPAASFIDARDPANTLRAKTSLAREVAGHEGKETL